MTAHTIVRPFIAGIIKPRLVAIAVDNWNTNRLIKIEVDDYLFEIKSEIQGGIEFQNGLS